MRNLLFLVFLFFISLSSRSQIVLDNNPPSIRWRQVNTPHFKVLYSPGFEMQAQRVANSLEHIREAEAKSLGSVPRKITVILQNQSAVSNGFVSILPRRSEFYGMPTQDYNFIGTNDWLDLLTAHEYRHIVQYQHATRGFNRLIYYLFGSISLAGMAQVAAPSWFWEGDAVVTETAFTPSGRGKIPNFGLLMKTNLLEGRKFNYHKQSLRSYKHNIPDHYVLGYYMVSYLRKKTNDPEVWGKITARSWNVPFIPFAFSNAIKKETGLYVRDLYNEMADQMTTAWRKELDGISLTPFVKVNSRPNHAYTDYLYPQILADGSVLVMKKGIGDIEQFVLLKDDQEKVFTPGLINDSGMLSAEKNVVVWNEYGFDPRWRVRNYSLIKTFNLSTGKKKRIGSKHGRYGSAAISPEGDKIAAIQTDLQYKTKLVILDAEAGSVIKEIQNPADDFYSMPRWSEDGKKIAVIKTIADGKTITIIDVASGNAKDVLPVTQENVGYPVLYDHYLLFNSPESGIDNIYAVDLNTGKRFQITSSRLGAYNPDLSKDGTTLVYNDQTRDGLDVVRIPFNPAGWQPFASERKMSLNFQHLVEQEGRPDIFKDVPDNKLEGRRYRKISGLINPYNWGATVESDLTEASIGITSRDILSTTAISLGYVFDINERTSALRGQVSYQGWYPIIDFSASISNRSVVDGGATFYDTLVDPIKAVTRDVIFKWKEKNVQAGLRIPLITTSSKYHGSLTIGNSVGLTQVSDFENNIDKGGRVIPRGDQRAIFYRDYVDNGKLLYNNFSLSAFRLLKQSRRDINSKWGQTLELNSFETPFGGDFDGRLASALGRLYFPGFTRHHSFWAYGAFQHTKFEQNVQNYVFRNQVPVPRGQSVSRFQNFFSLSANYTLPLWYPDVSIGPLLNFQRLRANLFFDYGFGQSRLFESSQEYRSVGVEAKLDINILRFLPQFDIGVRFTKGISPSTTEFEVLIGTFNF
ncbi:MAG: hypothetical protein ABIR06_02295 [Cyclobacteriaceae bacterium]